MKTTDDRVQQEGVVKAKPKGAQRTAQRSGQTTRKGRPLRKTRLQTLTEGRSWLDMYQNTVEMLLELDEEELSQIEHMVVSTLANSVMQEAMDLTLRQLCAKNGPGNGAADVPGARPADAESAKPNLPE
jgi:hypothetical protein